jgi:homopolymeric O-antigen transport system ATP-binding protein
MSDVAIRVAGLGKQYQIGCDRKPYKTIRESITDMVLDPLRRLRAGLSADAPNGEHAFWALKDVSFEVNRGEVVGIIGRNGAGKSTLLKILSRITEPTEGEVEITGRVGSLLEVGTGFHPELTGRENVYLNGAILGMKRSEIDRRFDEIVAFSEIERFLETPVKHYSAGMYTRLAFAVAAHLEPEILLIDEVLAVGDAAFQKKCLGKMGDVAGQGRTVLFISHNMGAINDLCARSILLNNGQVEIDGAPDKVIRTYLGHGSSATPTVELEATSSDAYFTKLGLQNTEGEHTTRFDVKKPITVLLWFTLARRIQAIEIGFAVSNHRADQLFYASNAYADPPRLVEDAGDHCVTVQIPGKLLLPGSYSISVALHRPNLQMYDYREHILRFDVEETGSGRYDYPAHTLGHVIVDLKWETMKGAF